MIFSKVAMIDLRADMDASQVFLMVFCAVGIVAAYWISLLTGKVFKKT